MPDFAQSIKDHENLPEDQQKKAGQAISGKMGAEHEEFLKTILKLLDEKQIDTTNPHSFINTKIYDGMPQDWKGKTDLALINIAHLMRLIEEFYKSKQTPNESPHLQQMIEELWQMKQRIEEKYDVFKF
ncbi:hypothetical protein K8942_03585 [Candidatus Peribacteria bacterium]|nr:MAG: hypothetical protein K8942_03585 [Candidatus Peribacteria bacterium]